MKPRRYPIGRLTVSWCVCTNASARLRAPPGASRNCETGTACRLLRRSGWPLPIVRRPA